MKTLLPVLASIGLASLISMAPPSRVKLLHVDDTNVATIDPIEGSGCPANETSYDGTTDFGGDSGETRSQIGQNDDVLEITDARVNAYEGTSSVKLQTVGSIEDASTNASGGPFVTDQLFDLGYYLAVDYFDTTGAFLTGHTAAATPQGAPWTWTFMCPQYNGQLGKVRFTLIQNSLQTYKLERTATTCGTTQGSGTVEARVTLYQS